MIYVEIAYPKEDDKEEDTLLNKYGDAKSPIAAGRKPIKSNSKEMPGTPQNRSKEGNYYGDSGGA